MKCTFYTCSFQAEKNGLCTRHQFLKPTTVKPNNGRMPKVSDKMKEIKKELKKQYPIYLENHPVCTIRSPHCTGKATCVNHTRGRGVHEVLDQETWEPSCGPCNSYVEQDPNFNNGKHKQSRHSKTTATK